MSKIFLAGEVFLFSFRKQPKKDPPWIRLINKAIVTVKKLEFLQKLLFLIVIKSSPKTNFLKARRKKIKNTFENTF